MHPESTGAPPLSRHSARLPALVFALALLAQLPLILNPGFFSHDELQWAAQADVPAGQALPWFSWTAFDIYQYRPLTFNLWLLLSRVWFDQPQLFHLFCVAWGSLNAALLAVLGRRFGMAARPAAIGALVFALGPYAVFVHGWVGTMADLIWLSCALATGLVVAGSERPWRAFAAAAVFTGIGLAGKEAAITIPPLLAVAWWFDARRPRWLFAAFGAGLVVLAYFALRAEAMLHPGTTAAQYTLSLWHPPLRWFEYQVFTPIPTVLETFATLARGVDKRVAIAALLWLALCAALWRSAPRLLALFLVGGAAALFAVLPLGSSWNHYGYGYAAITAMVVAAAWPTATRRGRAVIALMALLTLAHGAAVMLAMLRVGTVQAVFSPALAQVVAETRATATAPVCLRVAPDAKVWIFQRLTHDIPRYRGTPIGDRVQLVEVDAPADFVIQADGRLVAVTRR